MTAVPRRDLPFTSVLITGADGFVGRTLIPDLAAQLPPTARLTLCGRHATGAEDARVRRVPLDLTLGRQVAQLVADVRPDLVVHLAAMSSVAQSGAAAGAAWRVNLAGSLSLAEAIVAASDEVTVLFASSAEVYGATFADGIAREDSPLRPGSPYARSKAATEAMLADVLRPTDRLIVARPSNHTGSGQDSRFVLPSFAEQIARIEAGLQPPRLRVGDLSAERDFMDVRDVSDAYCALLGAAADLPRRIIFNIASGRTVAIGELLDKLVARSSSSIVVESDPDRFRPSEIKRAALDSSRLRQTVGWRPSRPLDDTLDAVLAAQRRRVGEAGPVVGSAQA